MSAKSCDRCTLYVSYPIIHISNGAALAQEIVATSVFPVTEILAIEDHKFNITFLYATFRSQILLKPTSDQIGSDTNQRTGEGDQRGGVRGQWESIKIPLRNLTYITKSTQQLSLLSRLRLHSYRKVIGSRNRVRYHKNIAEDNNHRKPRYVRDYGG
jgi:hypothetical protein